MSKLPVDFLSKLLELEKALLDKHPSMPILLREVHTALREQPENVTLMSEEEISIIIEGLGVQTKTEFAKSALSPSGRKSSVSKIKSLGENAF